MLKRLFHLLASLFLLSLIVACQQETNSETVRLSGQTMGTTWSLIMLQDSGKVDTKALQKLLQQRLDQINRLMSTYDSNSELSRFNQQENRGWFTISAETAHVLAIAEQISVLSKGAFDVSVGPLVELWGFGASKRQEHIPDDAQISANLARVGYRNLELRQSPPSIRKQVPALQIDLSAIAKGYAVDALADILEQQGVVNYLLEIGGELKIAGHRTDGNSWKIAIEKPLEEQREVARVFELSNTALATSGNYRNYYIEDGQRYSHTIDPVSGRPTRHKLASVTVLDPNCARADALATTLMVLGEERGRLFCEQHQIAAYFLIHEQTAFTAYASPAFRLFVGEAQL